MNFLKKLVKNKKFVGALLSVVLVGAGVAKPELIVVPAADFYCGVVKCDV